MSILRTVFFGGLCLAVFCVAGCNTKRTASGERIYFTKTAAYDKVVRTFTLTEQQARDRVVEFVRLERGTNAPEMIFVGGHMAIVGDCFVFSPPRKVGVSLAGYYVDGHTGHVMWRSEGYSNLPPLRK